MENIYWQYSCALNENDYREFKRLPLLNIKQIYLFNEPWCMFLLCYYIDKCKYFINNYYNLEDLKKTVGNRDLLYFACFCGRIKLIKYLLSLNIFKISDIYYRAAFRGCNLKTIKYLETTGFLSYNYKFEFGYPINKKIIRHLILNNRFNFENKNRLLHFLKMRCYNTEKKLITYLNNIDIYRVNINKMKIFIFGWGPNYFGAHCGNN